jgi:hypothetical protein
MAFIVVGFAQMTGINTGKIVVVLFQKLFSASLDLSPAQHQTLSTNLVETVFSPAYTFEEFAQSCSYGYWRTGNLPQVIAQSNYGRLLILSIDDNFINQKMMWFSPLLKEGRVVTTFQKLDPIELDFNLSNRSCLPKYLA